MKCGEEEIKNINSLPSLNGSRGETKVSEGSMQVFIELELIRFPICSGVSITVSTISEK